MRAEGSHKAGRCQGLFREVDEAFREGGWGRQEPGVLRPEASRLRGTRRESQMARTGSAAVSHCGPRLLYSGGDESASAGGQNWGIGEDNGWIFRDGTKCAVGGFDFCSTYPFSRLRPGRRSMRWTWR